ncbi:MAG: YidB family protein [Pseudomonadota bacterium]|nr:YidB family protein [Pseudomonadota bacterium]
MNIFKGLMGRAAEMEIAMLMNMFIEKNGGVQGIVSQFEAKGLGEAARSWISTGANQAITPDHIRQVFGSELMQKLGETLGVSPDQISQKLAEMLPQAISNATPNGTVPAAAATFPPMDVKTG